MRHYDILRMVEKAAFIWREGQPIREFFEEDDVKLASQSREFGMRCATLGTLLMFRCRPEFEHYQTAGQLKKTSPNSNRGRMAGPFRADNTNSAKVYFSRVFLQEDRVITWCLFDPKASYNLGTKKRFASAKLMDMLHEMGYVFDSPENVHPDNTSNQTFRNNWSDFLYSFDHHAANEFMLMTRDPNVPIQVQGVPSLPRHQATRMDDHGKVVYALRTWRGGDREDSCKIGVSKNEKSRRLQLQTGTEERLYFAYSVPGDFALEAFFKRKLQHARTGNGGTEWFRWPDVEKFIKQVVQPNPDIRGY